MRRSVRAVALDEASNMLLACMSDGLPLLCPLDVLQDRMQPVNVVDHGDDGIEWSHHIVEHNRMFIPGFLPLHAGMGLVRGT